MDINSLELLCWSSNEPLLVATPALQPLASNTHKITDSFDPQRQQTCYRFHCLHEDAANRWVSSASNHVAPNKLPRSGRGASHAHGDGSLVEFLVTCQRELSCAVALRIGRRVLGIIGSGGCAWRSIAPQKSPDEMRECSVHQIVGAYTFTLSQMQHSETVPRGRQPTRETKLNWMTWTEKTKMGHNHFKTLSARTSVRQLKNAS